MPDFIVVKKEQWLQPVLVTDAKDEEDALRKASAGDYTIHEDARYQCNVASPSWEVEETK